ncbi:MAG: hypothetical protein ACRD1K_04495 [Acidimicrobiales bacterium]
MFIVIDGATGAKVDLSIRKDRPFSFSELARRLPVNIDGQALFVASAEDVILAKLERARLGGSERQRRDLDGIIEVSGPSLDLDYLRHWAAELGLLGDLNALLRARRD